MKKRVRAILFDHVENIILIKRIKTDQEYWVFPGGGVEDGEDLVTALERECLEEIGVIVKVGEFIAENALDNDDTSQGVEYFYTASVISGTIGASTGLEFQEKSEYQGMHEIHSIPISEIADLNLVPESIKELVIHLFHT